MAAFYNDLNILYLRRDIYKIMSAYLIIIGICNRKCTLYGGVLITSVTGIVSLVAGMLLTGCGFGLSTEYNETLVGVGITALLAGIINLIVCLILVAVWCTCRDRLHF